MFLQRKMKTELFELVTTPGGWSQGFLERQRLENPSEKALTRPVMLRSTCAYRKF